MAVADKTCRRQGLVSGTAELSICILDKESIGFEAIRRPVASAHLLGVSTGIGRSFYEVAPVARWNRERYACAQLGLIPNSAAFGQCITKLDGAFLPNPN